MLQVLTVSLQKSLITEGGIKPRECLLRLYVTNKWEAGKVPQDFKHVLIVHIYERKSDRASCNNRRGISLVIYCWKNTWPH